MNEYTDEDYQLATQWLRSHAPGPKNLAQLIADIRSAPRATEQAPTGSASSVCQACGAFHQPTDPTPTLKVLSEGLAGYMTAISLIDRRQPEHCIEILERIAEGLPSTLNLVNRLQRDGLGLCLTCQIAGALRTRDLTRAIDVVNRDLHGRKASPTPESKSDSGGNGTNAAS